MRSYFQSFFVNWGRLTYRYRWLLIVVTMSVGFGLATQMGQLTIDTSTEGLLQKNDPTLLNYNAFRAQFGRDGRIIIAIEPPQVFDLHFLETLKSFHEELESEVPKIQEVKSLINARNTRGEGDLLIVEDFLETFPVNQEELELLKERALSNPLYRNIFISPDASLTAVVIETDTYSSVGRSEGLEELAEGFDSDSPSQGQDPPPFITGVESAAIIDAILEVTQRYEGPDFKIYMGGTTVVGQKMQEYISRDMRLFSGLSIGVIMVFLFVLFRRVSAMLLPLIVIVLSLTSTMGLMALSGEPITSTTQIIPCFLTAVGTSYAVHLLVVFYQRFNATGDKEESLVYAMGHSGVPILMTAITTIVGLMSFTAASIRPIAMFGVFVPVGVLVTFLYCVVLLPALLAVLPMRPKPGEVRLSKDNLLERFLLMCARLAHR
ncbi:MAG: MMPL family transporter, partial [Deltaproteobacteria bacterium]|nr:MMPL family transporter [Deltaproteobacteria bacterium]